MANPMISAQSMYQQDGDESQKSTDQHLVNLTIDTNHGVAERAVASHLTDRTLIVDTEQASKTSEYQNKEEPSSNDFMHGSREAGAERRSVAYKHANEGFAARV